MLLSCSSETVNNVIDAADNDISHHNIISYDDFMECDDVDEVVVEISDTDEYNISKIQDFLTTGGIVLQRYNNVYNDDIFDLPLESSRTTADSDDAECVASIYYGIAEQIGVKDILVESNDPKVIETAISDGLLSVKKRQEDASIKDHSVDANTEYTTEYIGEYSYLYTYIPYFQVDALYEVYTVQDLRSGKDYYTVMGYVFGDPGYVMNSTDKNYEKKYQCDNLGVTFESTTTGLTRKDYSPVRTVNSTTYNVTKIDVNSTTKITDWVVSYADFSDSQKQTSEFHPSIIWECPSSFDSAGFSITTSYQVDSWNTFPVSRSFTANITCYPDRIAWEKG